MGRETGLSVRKGVGGVVSGTAGPLGAGTPNLVPDWETGVSVRNLDSGGRGNLFTGANRGNGGGTPTGGKPGLPTWRRAAKLD